MNIKSQEVILSNVSPDTIYDFLSKPVNIEYLLPKSQISDWKYSDANCSFKVLNGSVTISLVANGGKKSSVLHYKSGEKSPFPFNLSIHMEKKNEDTKGYLEFNGEVNKFLKMIVEKPLTNLFNDMAEELKNHFSA